MDERIMPYFMAMLTALSIINLVFILGVPTAKQEFVCRGIIENPDAVRCYEQ